MTELWRKLPLLVKRERRILELLQIPTNHERPKTRGDCAQGPRPCPYVSCRHHLYLNVTPSGTIQYNYEKEIDELEHSCALDIADEGGLTLEEVGDILGITKERVRQISDKALEKFPQETL